MTKLFLCFVVAAVLFAVPCFADTILAIDQGGPYGGHGFPGPGSGFAFATEWSQTDSYTNMNFSALLLGINLPRVDAWITDVDGNILDSATDVVLTDDNGVGQPSENEILSGISLGPGTYYFLMAYAGGDLIAWIVETGNGAATVPGVSYLGSFVTNGGTVANPLGTPPPSQLPEDQQDSFQWDINADDAGGGPAPEPSTLYLLGSGALAVLCRARKRVTGS